MRLCGSFGPKRNQKGTTISEARRTRLKQALVALAKWASARAEGDHDTETTITMLKRRASEIQDQVDRAGWAASTEFKNDVGSLLFVYSLNGIVKCFSVDEISNEESLLLAAGWRHTATIDPDQWTKPAAKRMIAEFVSTGNEYKELAKSIRHEDGDRAWIKLDELKATWIDAAWRLHEQLLNAASDLSPAKLGQLSTKDGQAGD
jgi:hypothetical protein